VPANNLFYSPPPSSNPVPFTAKMFATLLIATLFIASALADFTVQTPTFTQCQNAKISWDDTNASPYNVIIVPSKEPCGKPLADLGDFHSSGPTWTVALPGGSKVVISVEDANGDEGWSKTITVQGSNDTSCLPNNSAAPSAAISDPSVGSVSASAPSSTGTNSGGPVAAAAGHNPLSSGALTMRQVSVPAIAISALFAAFVTAL
jgi:hypothetical protein